MGAPSSDDENDNDLTRAGKSFQRGVQDIGSGAEQIARGDVARGLQNAAGGYQRMATFGVEMPGQLKTEGEAEFQRGVARKQSALSAEAAKGAEETARRDRIANRLKEEIRLRQKTPGKQQTLLTSTLTPNSQFTGTLLTGAGRR